MTYVLVGQACITEGVTKQYSVESAVLAINVFQQILDNASSQTIRLCTNTHDRGVQL